jgi:hypothetical protein
VKLPIFQSFQLKIVTEPRQSWFFKVENNKKPEKPLESPANLA